MNDDAPLSSPPGEGDSFLAVEEARSRGGLGLGLALVKGLVDLHGGTIEVQSSGGGPEAGSRFVELLKPAS